MNSEPALPTRVWDVMYSVARDTWGRIVSTSTNSIVSLSNFTYKLPNENKFTIYEKKLVTDQPREFMFMALLASVQTQPMAVVALNHSHTIRCDNSNKRNCKRLLSITLKGWANHSPRWFVMTHMVIYGIDFEGHNGLGKCNNFARSTWL